MTIALVAIGGIIVGAIVGIAVWSWLAAGAQADLRDELACAKGQARRWEEMYEDAASESRCRASRIDALKDRVGMLARKLKQREEVCDEQYITVVADLARAAKDFIEEGES
jgi:gas vesicle protein